MKHKKAPKKTRATKPKGVRWANKEHQPLRHVQYYFPKTIKNVSKRYVRALNKDQLEALKEQQAISNLPYPEQTLREFDRRILPGLREAKPDITQKEIKRARDDFRHVYTEERTQTVLRAPEIITILMGWINEGTLKQNKKTKKYILTKKQKLNLLSDDFDELEIEAALELVNESAESAERRATAAAIFEIEKSFSSTNSSNTSSSSNSNSNSNEWKFKSIMKTLKGKR